MNRFMKKNNLTVLLVIVLLSVLISACGNENDDIAADEQQALKKVTVVLDWTPNTNHTGLYVAKAKGYYEDHGLDVEIIQPGEAGAANLVATGQAQFGVSYQEEVTYARTGGELPIVSLAAVIQHNTSGFASLAEENITSPKDFEGKVYGGWGGAVEKSVIDSLMRTENADVEKVQFADIGTSDFFSALERDIDFAWIYYAWDGVKAELIGKNINMIYLQDYEESLDYYTPVLITSEQLIEEDPALIEAFMKATSDGYQFAMKEPDEAADMLLAAAPDLDAELVHASQQWLVDQYQADAPRWGEQKQEVWVNYAEWMLQNGLLEKELDAEKAFTNDFLPAAQ